VRQHRIQRSARKSVYDRSSSVRGCEAHPPREVPMTGGVDAPMGSTARRLPDGHRAAPNPYHSPPQDRRGKGRKLQHALPGNTRCRWVGTLGEFGTLVLLARRRQLDWCLGKAQIFTAGAIIIFGATLKASPDDYAKIPFVQAVLAWMQSNAWLVVMIGPLLVALLQFLRRGWGNPWAWEAIQKVLDECRKEMFDDRSGRPLDENRVTLFRHYRYWIGWRNPSNWGSWLVAVARSDHMSKQRIRRFRAPDDPEKCEGVAGLAWRGRGWIQIPLQGNDLPELLPALSKNIETYAKETGVTRGWVEREIKHGRRLSKSYAALAILVGGKPWGVLVIDSQSRGAVDAAKLERFKPFASVLTPLLERV